MARPSKLSDAEIADRLKKLDGWRFSDGALRRDFQFADFNEAFGFMARAGLEAESMDHHPDWSNVYNKVSVALSTHDAGGVTELDFKLARFMNEVC